MITLKSEIDFTCNRQQKSYGHYSMLASVMKLSRDTGASEIIAYTQHAANHAATTPSHVFHTVVDCVNVSRR